MAELTFEQKIAKSSQVVDAKYSAEAGELSVVFRHSQIRYHYAGVPPETWVAMQAAESVGSFLHHNIKKPGFSFTKENISAADYDAMVERNAAVLKAMPVAEDKPA